MIARIATRAARGARCDALSEGSDTVGAMAYRWIPTPDPGLGPELDQAFDDQPRAEAWLAEHWEELLDEGVGSVTLVDDDRLVYGPMPLTG